LKESSLGVLDDYELAARSGESARLEFVSENASLLCSALVSAAHALHGRGDMLRITAMLRGVVWDAPRPVLRDAIVGMAAVQTDSDGPEFAAPVLKIAVERVSDAQLSSYAADSLATVFGSTVIDDDPQIDDACRSVANDQAMALVNSLITEVALSSSSYALGALCALLRRDFTRQAFCRRDGISTLASTLATDPSELHASIGQAVLKDSDADANADVASNDAVLATYRAAFAIWMLSFAASEECVQEVLRCALSSKLVLVLGRLVDHISGRRLKIARVVLATMRNLSSGETERHARIRREMVGTGLPAILRRLQGMHSTIGRDPDAVADLAALLESLSREQAAMSTVDNYLAEFLAGALRWSSLHTDELFWTANAEKLVTDVMPLLAETIANDSAATEARVVACNDLSYMIRLSVHGRRAALKSPTLKSTLMRLMTTAEDGDLRRQALICVQLLLLTHYKPKV
jgi:V-ATPase subunit H